jgi:hypothetical protein
MTEVRFTARQKQQAAAREVSQRQRVYPRLVDAGRLKHAEAERQIAVMQSIEADYRKLAEAEDAAGRLL